MAQDRHMVMATIYNDALLNDVISNDLERQQDFQRQAWRGESGAKLTLAPSRVENFTIFWFMLFYSFGL